MQHDVKFVGDEDFVRSYTPTTELETVFQFADIAPMDDTVVNFVKGGLAVAQEMVGAGNPLPSLEKFIGSQNWFLGVVNDEFEKAKPWLADSDRERIATKLETASEQFRLIGEGKACEWTPVVEAVYEDSVAHGVRL